MTWFTWKYQTLNYTFKARSRVKMMEWLRDLSKNRQLRNKFRAQKAKMNEAYKTVFNFCNN